MTAREFIECIIALDNCNGRNCSECALNRKNTKCNKTLCLIDTWEGDVDELLEIAKSGKSTVPTPEEKANEDIEKFIENPDRTALNDEFVEFLKLVAEKLKEVKQMERLTEWENGSVTYNEKREIECGEYCDSCSQGAGNCETIKNMIKKLADYEDLEEQGLLVRLPCKVGDTLYCIDNEIVELLIVNSFRIYNFNRIEIDFENASGFTLCTFSGELDEGYFLTREEAEKKLEEMKNE